MTLDRFYCYLFLFVLFLEARGHIENITDASYAEANATKYNESITYKVEKMLNCTTIAHDTENMQLRGELLLMKDNRTLNPSQYMKVDSIAYICADAFHEIASFELGCRYKYPFKRDQFEILPNFSALIGEYIASYGSYELYGTELFICYTYEEDIFSSISKIGGSISIVALAFHLVTFCSVPSIRNRHGYNLAALSLAFLLAFSFLIIGQIPEVLGPACIVSGVLQEYFFLAAFFWMNVMTFDVWRMVKGLTENLCIHRKKREYIWYSLYAWGCPALITTITVAADHIEEVPEELRPEFGRDDICYLTNNWAKIVFFAVPVFTLLFANVIFFLWSTYILWDHNKKISDTLQKQNVKLSLFFYLKLAVMMGFTWLLGVIGLLSNNDIIWLIHEILNSLQGLFLFVISIFDRKVIKHMKEKYTSKQSTTTNTKQTNTSKIESRSA